MDRDQWQSRAQDPALPRVLGSGPEGFLEEGALALPLSGPQGLAGEVGMWLPQSGQQQFQEGLA